MDDTEEIIQKKKQSLIDELDSYFKELEWIRQSQSESLRQKDIKIGDLQKEINRLKLRIEDLEQELASKR